MKLKELNKAKIVEILEILQAKRKSVVTPSYILKNLGFPIVSHSFIIDNKSVLSSLRQIFKQLEEEGFLIKRESKQDFLGIKEIGYDYVPKK